MTTVPGAGRAVGNADFGEPIGICRTAVLMSFKDKLTLGIELF